MQANGFFIGGNAHCLRCADREFVEAERAGREVAARPIMTGLSCAVCGVEFTRDYGMVSAKTPPAVPKAPRRGLRLVAALAAVAPLPQRAEAVKPEIVRNERVFRTNSGLPATRPAPGPVNRFSWAERVWRASLLAGDARRAALLEVLADVDAMAARELAAVNAQRGRVGADAAKSFPLPKPAAEARKWAKRLLG